MKTRKEERDRELLEAARATGNDELIRLTEEQINADTHVQRREEKMTPWGKRKGTLSLNAWEKFGDDRQPQSNGEGTPVDAPWATFSGGGGTAAPCGDIPCDIAGQPVRIQDAEWGRNEERVHQHATESWPRKWRRLWGEAWDELYQAFEGLDDPLFRAKDEVTLRRRVEHARLKRDLLEGWVEKWAKHSELNGHGFMLVDEILSAYFARGRMIRRRQFKTGESLRDIAESIEISKSTLARIARGEEHTIGDDMTAETERALRRIIREENEGLLDAYEARRQARELIPEIEDYLAGDEVELD